MSDAALIDHLGCLIDEIVGDRNPVTAPAHHERVPLMMFERWRGFGLAAEVDEFECSGFTGRNVWVPPAGDGRPVVVLIAHHDTVPYSPGADDNGSGVAAVDALARLLAAQRPGTFDVGLCLTDFEEGDPVVWTCLDHVDVDVASPEGRAAFIMHVADHHPGSTLFSGARRLLERLEAADLTARLDVLLNLETVGYTAEHQEVPGGVPIAVDRGDFLGLAANQAAGPWVQRLAPRPGSLPLVPLIVPGDGTAMPDTRRSDHAPFWDRDLPAIMLTDTANFRNPHYHLPSDTEVDLRFLAAVVDHLRDALFGTD